MTDNFIDNFINKFYCQLSTIFIGSYQQFLLTIFINKFFEQILLTNFMNIFIDDFYTLLTIYRNNSLTKLIKFDF